MENCARYETPTIGKAIETDVFRKEHLLSIWFIWINQPYPGFSFHCSPDPDYPPEIRKVIYTTNAIESVNMSLRKLTKNRGSFPSDEALLKLFYLALRNISKKWTMPIRDWKAALNRFTIQFEGRLPQR